MKLFPIVAVVAVVVLVLLWLYVIVRTATGMRNGTIWSH